MSQLVQATVLAQAGRPAIVAADRHPSQSSIGGASASSRYHCDGFAASGERVCEPTASLERVDVRRTGRDLNRPLSATENLAPQVTDRQAGSQLRVVRRLLQVDRMLPSGGLYFLVGKAI
ncbi:hypothetical protein ACFV9C_33290 [Kribbella sp. NPDC059898]|uniref:hypothetical protein n=1 Tax=Kribbella sp. NPDC059898 TaxID=3346995 RepID=UPI00365BD41B